MMGDEQTPTPQRRGQWRYCFCGRLAQVEGVCQAHYDLWQLVDEGLWSDWGERGLMSHKDMMTDKGIDLQRVDGVCVSDGDMEIVLAKLRRRWHFYAAQHTGESDGEAA